MGEVVERCFEFAGKPFDFPHFMHGPFPHPCIFFGKPEEPHSRSLPMQEAFPEHPILAFQVKPDAIYLDGLRYFLGKFFGDHFVTVYIKHPLPARQLKPEVTLCREIIVKKPFVDFRVVFFSDIYRCVCREVINDNNLAAKIKARKRFPNGGGIVVG